MREKPTTLPTPANTASQASSGRCSISALFAPLLTQMKTSWPALGSASITFLRRLSYTCCREKVRAWPATKWAMTGLLSRPSTARPGSE